MTHHGIKINASPARNGGGQSTGDRWMVILSAAAACREMALRDPLADEGFVAVADMIETLFEEHMYEEPLPRYYAPR